MNFDVQPKRSHTFLQSEIAASRYVKSRFRFSFIIARNDEFKYAL